MNSCRNILSAAAAILLLTGVCAHAGQAGADSAAGTSGTAGEQFLDVRQAFSLQPRVDGNELSLEWIVADGYYLYRHHLRVRVTVDGVELRGAVQLPAGRTKVDEAFGEVEVYYRYLRAVVPLPAGWKSLGFSVSSQGCADAGLCYPPLSQDFQFDADLPGIVEVKGAGSNVVVAAGQVAASEGNSADTSLLLVMLFAFLGGVILNLMPCVFPVLALKMLGLANAGTTSGTERRNQGLGYAAGVLSSFIAMAAVLLVFRSAGEVIGWGFQLQSPWFVALLVYLFIVLGQSMAGYVEFTPGFMGAGASLAARGGLTGSFFTGMLAVVVASPCTAPFMGAALGFALVQPSIIALAVFAALGLGMAAPFLLLVAMPSLARTLPRPGAWMQTFKEVMAFPLYLTAVWLLWVLGRQTGVDGMSVVALGCVLVFLSLWLWRLQTATGKTGAAAVAALALALLCGPWMQRVDVAAQGTAVYSAERVQALQAEGRSVFVNLTADWCLTCLANERVALSRSVVQEAFVANNIAYLKGDWTNSDPRITELLQVHGRSGVPLYLLYPANSARRPIVLPQILTPATVLASIAEL